MRDGAPALARRIGLFDATMIVMGGIVGSGIFVTPAIVARAAGSPFFIVTAWIIGGAVALLGAFVYAELSSARPEVGGQYAYLREALHPLVAFLYGWALLLVIETGGKAPPPGSLPPHLPPAAPRPPRGAPRGPRPPRVGAARRPATARPRRAGAHGRARAGRDDAHPRRARRGGDLRRYRCLDARLSQPIDPDGAARVLRHGGG